MSSTLRRLTAVAALGWIAAACVPPRPPPPRGEGQQQLVSERPAKKPATEAPNGPSVQEAQAKRTDGLEGGELVFSDEFEREAPGPDWDVKHPSEWVIREGELVATRVARADDRNKGVWLVHELPEHARVEFTARSLSGAGDTKCEVFATEPAHEAGYSVIFGGWNNTINTIARRGEHEKQRVVQTPHRPVEKSRKYRWAIVRNDDVVRWYVDGQFMLAYEDKEPVRGGFFGFNNWATDVRFDDVRVFKLPAAD